MQINNMNMSVRPSDSVCSSDVELDHIDPKEPKYQPLSAEIQVPKEWPVEAARSVIVDVIKMAIDSYLSGQMVIVTIGKVSALVAENETRTGYLLERTQDTDDEEAYQIELLMPAKAEMLSLEPNGRKRCEPESIQIERLPLNLRSNHPISRMFVTRFNRHEVLTVVPNIEKTLSLKGITGPEIYNHVLKVTYIMQNVSRLNDSEPKQEPEPSTSARLFVSAERVTDSEWKVVCFERVMPPRRRWITCKTVFIGIFSVLGVVTFVLIIYYLVLEIK